tara:strand:+ start:2615 stop:3409 length:795 start_codon:yes stop_codon:yes gene_type:complete
MNKKSIFEEICTTIEKPVEIFEEIYTETEMLKARAADVSGTDIASALPFGDDKVWHYDPLHGRRVGRLKLQSDLVFRSPPGDIVELGAGAGNNIALYIRCLKAVHDQTTTIYGFDTFEGYIEEHISQEPSKYASLLKENQGSGRWHQSKDDLQTKLNSLVDFVNIELVKGNICETTKNFQPRSKEIGMVNIDTNVYKPAIEALFNLEKYFVDNTLLIVDSGFLGPDDTLQGEHRALYEYATKRNYPIFRSNWGDYCSFIAVVQK